MYPFFKKNKIIHNDYEGIRSALLLKHKLQEINEKPMPVTLNFYAFINSLTL